jgi:hypothetical protein
LTRNSCESWPLAAIAVSSMATPARFVICLFIALPVSLILWGEAADEDC